MVRNLFKTKSGIKLDIGCGNNRQEGFVTLDRSKECKPDIIWDIQKFPYPIPKEACHMVLMSHIWEHIEPKFRVDVLNEVWRICRKGGQVLISTPYYLSFWASQDPTHYPCANEATFTYFDPRYELYKVYTPKPWKLKENNYTMDGNVEVILEK